MGFKGSVDSFSLADVLQNLAMNQQTGTLHVFLSGGAEKFVYFENGQIRDLSHGTGRQLMPAEVFYARGYIGAQALEEVLNQCRQTSEVPGLVLLGMGHISREQFETVTRLQIEEEIYDLFGWENASFEFDEGDRPENLFPPQPESYELSVPISAVIMEAARRVDEWERLRRQVPSFREIYVMDSVALKAIEKGEMEADPTEKRVATMIDGSRDVEDVIQDSALFKFEVLNALAGLLQSSLVRPATLPELLTAEQECARKGLPRRRIKVLERLLALGGENAHVRRELAEALARDEQIDKACIHFAVLAESELQEFREDNAAELYRRILMLAPKHLKAHEQLGVLYARRNQKREAFAHYRELYEIFRDQNHPLQARAAAAAALECDPGHIDLRNALVELLMNDGQKDAAAQQLEAMGDHAAKGGMTKLAVDSYRRALQLKPTHKLLKKKLSDVMLTKEDRRSRRQRLLLAGVAVLFVLAAIAGVFVKEQMNGTLYANADGRATVLWQEAAQLEDQRKFLEAKTKYETAVEIFLPIERCFSPFFKFDTKAHGQVRQFRELADAADGKATRQREELSRKADIARDNGESALRAFRVYEAIKRFDECMANEYISDETMAKAKEGKTAAQKLIDDFNQAQARLVRNPNEAFANIDEEWLYKQSITQKFQNFSEFKMPEIDLPLLITPNTDEVKAYLDGRFLGTISINAPRENNTFRYSLGEPHRFEFKKPGFKTVALNAGEAHSPLFRLNMEREPSMNINLRARLTGDLALSGNVACDEYSVYVGTTEGGILQVSPEGRILREFSFPRDEVPLSREVYGPITLIPRPNKSTLLVYSVKAGDSFGLELVDGKFHVAWRVRGAGRDLSAPPAMVELNRRMLALPVDRSLVLLDPETGSVVDKPFDFKATITSSATGSPQDLSILAGCQDGRIRGVSLKTRELREWSPNIEAAAIRGRPALVDGDLMAGADDGVFYVFRQTRTLPTRALLDNAGPVVVEPLIARKKAYVGSIEREGFYCIDLMACRQAWRTTESAIGDVRFPAVAYENQVYFGTDRGRLYALDAERGIVRWMYQVQGAQPLIGPPVVRGNRIIIASKDGIIAGFDE